MRNAIQDTTDALLNTPLVDLADRVQRWKTKGPGIEYFPPADQRATQDEVIRRLDDMMQHCARLRGYLDSRYGSGCGDQGHDDGVKSSNRLVRKVRKALGFTYPGNDITF